MLSRASVVLFGDVAAELAIDHQQADKRYVLSSTCFAGLQLLTFSLFLSLGGATMTMGFEGLGI